MEVSAKAGILAKADTPTTNIVSTAPKRVTNLDDKGGLSVSIDSRPVVSKLQRGGSFSAGDFIFDNLKQIAQKKQAIIQAKIDADNAAQEAAVEAAQQVQEQAAAQIPTPAPQPVYVAPVAQTGCGSDPYQQLVYQFESGCSTTAVNPNGCYGLGQDCNGIVENQCGADWTCQNNYFTQYMLSRYGSWAIAWAHEQAVSWW